MPRKIPIIKARNVIEIDVPAAYDPFERGKINNRPVFRVAADAVVKSRGPLAIESRASLTQAEKNLYFFACKMAGGAEIIRSTARPSWYVRWKIRERLPQWVANPLVRLTPGTTTYYVIPYCSMGPSGNSMEKGIARATQASNEMGPTIPTITRARMSGLIYVNGEMVSNARTGVPAPIVAG